VPTEVTVKSNVDSLSAVVLRAGLMKLVDEAVLEGAIFMRGIVPKESGELAAHVDSVEALEIVDMIEAKLGVHEIGESDVPGFGGKFPSPRFDYQASDRSHYPEFVDRGTGIHGDAHLPIYPRHGSFLVYPQDGKTIYARSVQGQRPQHFMAATFAYVREMIKHDGSIKEALHEMSARASLEKLV